MDGKHYEEHIYISNPAMFRGARVYKIASETLREHKQNWAAIINACLAVEIYLKCLNFKIVVNQDAGKVNSANDFKLKPYTENYAAGHNLHSLFEAIPEELKSVFEESLEQYYPQKSYLLMFEKFKTVFTDERYMYEPDSGRNNRQGKNRKKQKSSSNILETKSALSTEIVDFAIILDGVVLNILKDKNYSYLETIIVNDKK